MGAEHSGPSRKITANAEESLAAIGGVLEKATLEVRWIRPGALAPTMTDWFGPFVAEIETRDDLYLVGLGIEGLSVKIRGGTLLDIKGASGDQGIIEMRGHSVGRSQAWKKWSFPLSISPETGSRSADWVRVGKYRRIGLFAIADGEPTAQISPSAHETTCTVELTEVTRGAEAWWTLGFEATGRPHTLREAIEVTAALVFAAPLPVGKLSVVDSMSYADWLRPSVAGSNL